MKRLSANTGPLRILFVSGEYPPMQGGVADYTRALSRALVGLGHEVGVLASVGASQAPDEPSITVFPLIAQWEWRLWASLDRLIERWQADVVHIQYQTAAFGMHPAINLWPKWTNQTKALTVVTFHDLLVPYLFPKAHWLGLRQGMNHILARGVDLAITTNPEDSANLRGRRPGLAEIPIGSNIPCAPPPDFDRPGWRARLGLPPRAAALCYFGFLNASKGGEMLIDVLAGLAGRGIDAHLLMIGGRVGASDPTNAAYLQQVEARIAAAGLAGRVHWTGHVSAAEVSAAFLASDLCLLPYQDGVSYRRGSFMAALAHGLPILTTPPAVPYPDLIDGETLLLLPPDPAAWVQAAARVLAEVELKQKLGENARRLSERFTWPAIAATTLTAYHAAALTIDG